jgi:hypothetical protein
VIPRAREPFRFFSRLSLTVLTGAKAKDLGELLENLKTVPESVIYHHTHQFLQQHQYLAPEPPNDFAYWATHMLQDEKLGERLAAIDTIRFSSLNDLRQALVSAVESHLEKHKNLRQVPDGKEFHFMSAIRFSVPTPHQAHDLAEFADRLKKVSLSSLYLHVFEARLRPPLGINDFSNWFEKELGEKALAQKVAGLDPYSQTLEGLRSKMIGLIEKRLQELSHAAP